MTYPHWDDDYDAYAAWHQHEQEQQQYLSEHRSTHMKFSELVPTNSQYLKKEDVGPQGKNLTIKHFTRVKVSGDKGEETKAACHWVQPDYKPLLLNVTNGGVLEALFGDTDGAKGKTVNVYFDRLISFGGKTVGGIRIREATGEAEPVGGEGGGSAGVDEDIPF